MLFNHAGKPLPSEKFSWVGVKVSSMDERTSALKHAPLHDLSRFTYSGFLPSGWVFLALLTMLLYHIIGKCQEVSLGVQHLTYGIDI